ncbi:alpha/beta hydrolase [Kribbella sp. NPDC056861]|uniref:alpha/beta fold hydrolase n=1 Tax=Kribbella sp. NPDC056861 TaxID=3154857 RepID=UPI0034215878
MPFADNTTTDPPVRLHWQERGTGDPIVLVMGHLFSGEMWYPVIPALAAEHRVVWFDNRGAGRSGATSTATVSDLAADVRTVMDAAGIERAHVYGVSMGGGIAIQLAYESPERVRSLVLGCTALRSPTLQQPPLRGPFLGKLRYRLPAGLTRGLRKKGLYGSIAPADAVERDLDTIAKLRWSPRGVYAQDLAIHGYDMTPDKVAQLTMPALVLHGTEDKAVPYGHATELLEALPAARLVTYEGAGHNFIVDCTERANSDVLAFFGEQASTS